MPRPSVRTSIKAKPGREVMARIASRTSVDRLGIIQEACRIEASRGL
jgi:hypothetical protein